MINIFEIKKAKSRMTDVEFIKIDLNEIKEYMMNAVPDEIEDSPYEKYEVCKYNFSITDKFKIILEKNETKEKQSIKSFSVRSSHIAWNNKGVPVWWNCIYTFDVNNKAIEGCNYIPIRIPLINSHSNLLYIVFEGGFTAENMRCNPYFLRDVDFKYIYEEECN